MFVEGKRGQVAIMIIVAIAIVVIVLVIFFVNKPGGGLVKIDSSDPKSFLKGCIEKDLRDSVEAISKHGGDFDPEGAILYKGEKIKYLCHSSQYYELCSVQQPLIKEHIENELVSYLDDKVERCVDNLVDAFEKRGSSVSRGDVDVDFEFVPGKAELRLEIPLTITDEVSRSYKNFDLEYDSEMYDLLAISDSIVSFEASFGDSEVTSYTQYYPSLIIRKEKLGDGSTIYSVEDVVSKEKFMFASRSLAWPSGIRGE